jgi:hypothetical protein
MAGIVSRPSLRAARQTSDPLVDLGLDPERSAADIPGARKLIAAHLLPDAWVRERDAVEPLHVGRLQLAPPREKVAAHQRVGLRPGLVVAFWVSSLMATIKDFPMDTNNKKTADVPHIRLLSRPEVYST